MKTNYLLLVSIVLMIVSCGAPKQITTVETVIVPPPTGVEVMNIQTKVFASINLPQNDYWVVKNEDATWRHDEFLVKKMTPSNGEVAVIRTQSYGGFSTDLNDAKAVEKSIDGYAAGLVIKYNDFWFKYDGEGNKIEDPVHTTKLDTLENGYLVVVVEAEVKNTQEEHRFFGRSYYARNYYYLAKKDEKNCIPIISSSVMLLPENYETEKRKFIELVDYVVNTAVVNPEFEFEK